MNIKNINKVFPKNVLIIGGLGLIAFIAIFIFVVYSVWQSAGYIAGIIAWVVLGVLSKKYVEPEFIKYLESKKVQRDI